MVTMTLKINIPTAAVKAAAEAVPPFLEEAILTPPTASMAPKTPPPITTTDYGPSS